MSVEQHDPRPRFQALFHVNDAWQSWGWYSTWEGAERAAEVASMGGWRAVKAVEWGEAEVVREVVKHGE